MNYSRLKFPKSKPRYRIKNLMRFIAVILVVLLTATAVLVILAKNKDNNLGDNGDLAGGINTSNPTKEPIPEPTPEPTPTPYPVPEGKSMDPFLVIIDAGHGGADPGTYSRQIDGLYEKDIVLDIAKKTKNILDEKGINAVLSREEDGRLIEHNDKDLVARWSFANDINASLFVSLHVNAYDLKAKGAASVNGMEIYYFENKAEIFEGFTQQRFAEIMRDTVTSANEMKFRFMEGKRQLAVVRNTKMPAVLIETAYITNKEDHDRLKSEEFREKTALGIAEGIEIAMEEIGVFEHNGEMYVFKEIGE